QRTGVEFLGCLQPLQRQALRRKTVRRNNARPALLPALQPLPRLLVEFPGHPHGRFAQLALLLLKDRQELQAHRIAFRAQFLRPVFQNLHIPQFAQLAKEFPPQLAHFPPGPVGVHLLHHRRHRTASPQRHAQVVHRVRLRRGAHLFQFLQGAFHPIAQAAMLGMRARQRISSSHVVPSWPKPRWPAAPGARSYRLALCRSRVQWSVLGQSSGSMRASTKTIAMHAAAQIRKTRPGSGCPRRNIAYCTNGWSAMPPNESRLAAPMTRPFTSGRGRFWISAFTGTTKNPAHTPSAPSSPITI